MGRIIDRIASRRRQLKIKISKSIVTKVSTIISIILIALICAILFGVNKLLKRGLTDYFDQQIQEKQKVFITEVDLLKSEVKTQSKYLADTLAKDWDNYLKNKNEMDHLLYRTSRDFQTDCMFIYDNSLTTLSKFESIPTNILGKTKRSVIDGEKYTDVIKNGSDLIIVSGHPIVIEGKTKGAVFSVKRFSTSTFLNKIKSLTGCEITIFYDYTRHVTTLKGLEGTTIADYSIIDYVNTDNIYKHETILNDTKYMGIYFPLKNTTNEIISIFFMGIETEVKDTLINTLFKKLSIPVVFVFLLILFALYVLIYIPLLLRPLNKLNTAVYNLNSGEADLSLRIPIKGEDELGAISNNTNSFIETLQEIVKELLENNEKLEKIVENLSSNSQESAGAITQIFANIEGVRHQSQNQSDSVTNTGIVLGESQTSLELLIDLIHKETQGISEASAAIEQMLSNIRSVTISVQKADDSFNDLSSNVSEGKIKLANVNNKIQQIQTQSAMLTEANSIISQISSQTNLLAMNAAIEAAHAGEAGRGFSVVADEIRKLAENSAVQSKKISQELKNVTHAITEVVSSAGESQKSFENIVQNMNQTDQIIKEINHAMEEQEEASKQVFQALTEMKSNSQTVSQRSEQLAQNVSMVSTEMEKVTQISQTILGSMDEMTSGVSEINTSAQDVSNLALETKDAADSINTVLKRFKV